MTLQSTLGLVAYLFAEHNFKYVLTSKLSQDKVESLFAIVRHFNGSNDYLTPALFLELGDALAFLYILYMY